MRNLVNLLFFAAVAASTLVLPARAAQTLDPRDAGTRLVALTTFAQTSCPAYKLDRNALDRVYRRLGFDPGSMTDTEVDAATIHLRMMKNGDRQEWCSAAWETFGENGDGYPGVLVRY